MKSSESNTKISVATKFFNLRHPVTTYQPRFAVYLNRLSTSRCIVRRSLLHNRTGPFNDYTKLQPKHLSSVTRGIATAAKNPRLSPGGFVQRKFSCRLRDTKLIILCHMVPLALDKHIVYYYPASEILSHVKPSFLTA
jgi:hypothetical protein